MKIANRKGAKDAKEDVLSEADREFSFADLRIGKRRLSVLGALSEAPQVGMRARAVQPSFLTH